MENRINQVMELENGKKYVVIKQAIYKGHNYFVAARLTDDENDVMEEYSIFEEVEYNGKASVQKVTDGNLFNLIVKYVGLAD